MTLRGGKLSLALAVLAGLAAMITTPSCGSTSAEEGTNTNWVACNTDADCTKVASNAFCDAGICRLSTSLQACNDGTGKMNCCPESAESGKSCSEPVQCWTPCTSGWQSQFVCSGGTWVAGHGLFPCGRDAGASDAGGDVTGSADSSSSNNAGNDAGASWDATSWANTTCTWPDTLGAIDASARDTCSAARTLLSCDYETGGTVECMTNDWTCDGSVSGSCVPRCEANEYVAACGGAGPGPIPEPPLGCRSLGAIPAGVVFYCCPCGQ
jgi:hypothetical protein